MKKKKQGTFAAIHGIREFETVTLNAMHNYEDFGVVLTRLWVNAGVRVEWSMPPGMADNL